MGNRKEKNEKRKMVKGKEKRNNEENARLKKLTS
jgi:hypothetical protein